MTRVLITGVNGFCGRHLANYLTAQAVEVYGISRVSSSPREYRLPEPVSVSTLCPIILVARPHYVFHLAGVTAADEPATFYHVNTAYAANLLRALEKSGYRNCPVLLVGSAAEYGEVTNEQLPITESHTPRPYSHYGISKLAQTQLGLAEARSTRPVIIVRPFNIIGAHMPAHLVVQSLALQIADILWRRRSSAVRVGNLQSARDFVDVADVVEVYWRLIQAPAAYGEIFNVCSGIPVKISDVLSKMIELVNADIEIEVDPSRFKPVDIPLHYGSPEKLLRFLDCRLNTSLESSLKRILEAARGGSYEDSNPVRR
jgi:GDP-4-dehydro-6-deoxy-D-mannose reductase